MTKEACMKAFDEGAVVIYAGHPYLITAVALRRRVTRDRDLEFTVDGPCYVRCELLQVRGGHSIHVACEDLTFEAEEGADGAPGR